MSRVEKKIAAVGEAWRAIPAPEQAKVIEAGIQATEILGKQLDNSAGSRLLDSLVDAALDTAIAVILFRKPMVKILAILEREIPDLAPIIAPFKRKASGNADTV
jgi:hypothetical protein